MHHTIAPSFFKEIPGGVEFLVRLTPKASSNRIADVIQDSGGQFILKAYVTAVPENNKANEALIKLLAKTWGVPKTSFTIVSGLTDRNKRIRIMGSENVLRTVIF